jgi:hypothetical protein
LEKDLEGNGRGLTKAEYLHLSGGSGFSFFHGLSNDALSVSKLYSVEWSDGRRKVGKHLEGNILIEEGSTVSAS